MTIEPGQETTGVGNAAAIGGFRIECRGTFTDQAERQRRIAAAFNTLFDMKPFWIPVDKPEHETKNDLVGVGLEVEQDGERGREGKKGKRGRV